MRRLLVLIFAAAWALAAHAQDATAPAQIGGTRIELPVPAGFVEPSTVLPAFRTIGEQMTASTNRLLALFVTEDDLAAARERRPPAMRRYFMVQTLRAAEAARVGTAEFDAAKSMLRGQYQTLLASMKPTMQSELDRASQRVREQAGVDDFALKIGEVRMLDVFDEQPRSISMLAATMVGVDAGGRSMQVPMAMANTTLVVRDKLVYFFAYARYESEADLDWLRGVTREWLPKLAQLN